MDGVRKANKNTAKEAIYLDVPCAGGPLSPGTAAFVLRELVKYFLFMRGQLPGMFDELSWRLQVRLPVQNPPS